MILGYLMRLMGDLGHDDDDDVVDDDVQPRISIFPTMPPVLSQTLQVWAKGFSQCDSPSLSIRKPPRKPLSLVAE